MDTSKVRADLRYASRMCARRSHPPTTASPAPPAADRSARPRSKLRALLSEEDAALFRAAVGEVRRIDDDRHRPLPLRPPSRPRASPPATEVVLQGLSTAQAPLDDLCGEALWFCRPGVQQRVVRRLKRGQIPLRASLDLHGLRADEASERLARFLGEATARDWRAVHVVHGKGRGSGREGPVLKAMLDRWLRLRPEVAAFCTAQPRDGGTGALYVLLRRRA